eukprot:Sspe_Gene.22448::Locus_8545_Transcript_1_2_Confidence_0.429_Length_1516::g.22448::m.22448
MDRGPLVPLAAPPTRSPSIINNLHANPRPQDAFSSRNARVPASIYANDSDIQANGAPSPRRRGSTSKPGDDSDGDDVVATIAAITNVRANSVASILAGAASPNSWKKATVLQDETKSEDEEVDEVNAGEVYHILAELVDAAVGRDALDEACEIEVEDRAMQAGIPLCDFKTVSAFACKEVAHVETQSYPMPDVTDSVVGGDKEDKEATCDIADWVEGESQTKVCEVKDNEAQAGAGGVADALSGPDYMAMFTEGESQTGVPSDYGMQTDGVELCEVVVGDVDGRANVSTQIGGVPAMAVLAEEDTEGLNMVLALLGSETGELVQVDLDKEEIRREAKHHAELGGVEQNEALTRECIEMAMERSHYILTLIVEVLSAEAALREHIRHCEDITWNLLMHENTRDKMDAIVAQHRKGGSLYELARGVSGMFPPRDRGGHIAGVERVESESAERAPGDEVAGEGADSSGPKEGKESSDGSKEE